MNKSFLIKMNNRCYCSRCMKEIDVNKELSKELHEKECNTHFIDFNNAYSPEDTFSYKLTVENSNLILHIMQGYLNNNFMDFKSIYKAEFSINSRIIKEQGEKNIDYWLDVLKNHFYYDDIEDISILNINEKPEIKIIQEVFPNIPYIKNICEFITIYKNKGYYINEKSFNKELNKIQSQRINLNIGKENHRTKVKYCFLKEHEVLDEIFFEVTYVEGKCIKGKIEPSIKNRCMISKNYIYNPKNMDLSLLNSEDVFYPIFKYDKFDKKYPELKLGEYIKTGGKKIIPFIFSSNTDFIFELIGKSGLGYIADNYNYIKNLNTNENNLKNIFNMPVKALKCLNSVDFIDYIKKYNNMNKFIIAYNHQKMIYTSVFNKSTIEFIHETIGPASRLNEFNINDLLKYVNYTQSKVFNNYKINNIVLIQTYIDYLNMCYRDNLYPGGKYPEDLIYYHDLMCRYRQEKIEAKNQQCFSYAIENNRYKNLATEENDKDDYVILLPRNSEDLVNESYNMNNCVRSYINAVAREHTYILFLRRKNKKSTSFVTIEVTCDYVLRQVKATHNTKPSEKVCDFVRKWAEKKEIDISMCHDL